MRCRPSSATAVSVPAAASSNSSPPASVTGNTRAAYARAVKQFLDWCEDRRLELHEIDPLTVAAYVEQPGSRTAKPTVKQHLAAIRQLFAYLTSGGILEANPAASVRGPKYVVKRGKTPVRAVVEARQLLDSIESDTLIGPRDLKNQRWSIASRASVRRWR